MRFMRILLLLLSVFPPCIRAQEEFKRPHTTGYLFAAPGRIASEHASMQVGGGIEGYFYKGLGFGVDGGAMNTDATWSGFGSLNVVYNFQNALDQKLAPFLTGGGTVYQGFEVIGGFHYGGGVQYWPATHYGIRLEFRGVVRSGRHTYHDVHFRIGLALRP
jgi:hypothetical protein